MNAQQLTVFLEYTKRYEELARDFPPSVRSHPSKFDREYEARKNRNDDKVQHAVHGYFNLCSQEFYLHRAGILSDDVWTMWKLHILALLKSPLFAEAWSVASAEYDCFPEFQAFMKGLRTKK